MFEIKSLADRTGVPILVLHHERKMEATDVLDTVSGSTGVTAAADTILLLKRERGEADASLHVTGRDVDERETGLKFDKATCRWTMLGDGKELRMQKTRRQIFEAIKESPEPMTPKQIAEATDLKEPHVRVTLRRMDEDGQVKGNYGKYAVP
jgi:hypothetical protein